MRLTALLSRFLPALLLAFGILLALLPWWRNHGYLRDFYDYGTFIKVNARLDAGQRPWVDFTTPAQSASFLGNYWAEKIGGGTYQGMTRGAAALIIVMVGTLALVLARRWQPGWAIGLAVSVAVCSASQHTIIFYNPIGVFALALVAWGFAIAPVMRWENAGWHLVAGCGLVLGGINKINFHLLACGMAVGWLLWAWLRGQGNLGRLAAGICFVVVAGVIVPVAIELAWSGADLRTWCYNIVQLPLQARGGRLALLADTKFYLRTVHDYYGEMRLPPAGAIVLLVPLAAGLSAWWTGRQEGWRRGLFSLGAGCAAGLGGALLLLTNNEIVYLTLAASLVLTVSIWLGFGLEPRGWRFAAVVLLPAAVFALAGWESAWLGQRSQFGHAVDPRSDYVDGGQVDPELGYLRGTRVPPGWGISLQYAALWRRELPPEARDCIYYGPGLEFLERVWPSRMERGLPLIMSGFDVERDIEIVRRTLAGPGGLSHLLVVEAWDYPPVPVGQLLRLRFEKERVGSGFIAYSRLPDDAMGLRTLEHMPEIGGNADPSLVATKMSSYQLRDGRRFRGVEGGAGKLDLLAGSNRSTAEAVLRRPAGAPRIAVTARFHVYAVNGAERYERWRAELVLPADADELVVPTPQIDGSALPLSFTVEAPTGLLAGWRELTLSDSVERNRIPPRFAKTSVMAYDGDDAFANLLLGGRLPGARVWNRHAQLVNGACVIRQGGEVWIKLTGLYAKIEIVTRSVAGAAVPPTTSTVYYKGGRVELFHPLPEAAPGTRRFRVWSPETGGWLGILNQGGNSDANAVIIEITAVERAAN